MCLSMVLTSCDMLKMFKKTEELKFSDVFKTVPQTDEYTYLSSNPTTLNITGSVYKSDYSSSFLVSKQNPSSITGLSSATIYYRVYDVNTGRNVKTFTESNQTSPYTYYYFDLINDEYFAVLKETYEYSYNYYDYYTREFGVYLQPSSAQYTVEIYDKTGTVVDSADASGWYYDFDYYYANEFEEYLEDTNSGEHYEGQLFYEDNKLYKYENDEKIFIKEFGVEYMPDVNYIHPVGNYYYRFNGSSAQFFNESLEPVASYTFPSYANLDSQYASFAPLGNNKVYIQYTETLHQDAKDYDFREDETGKYDLVTLVFNITDGTATELKNVDYKVASIVSTRMKNAEEDYLNDVVDNVAMIYYIDENEHLNISTDNCTVVGMSDDGEITATINIAGNISELPEPYGDNLFYARATTTYNMYYIYNAQGEIVSYRSMDNSMYGDYIYTDYGIYNLNGDEVYDLEGKEIIMLDGNSALIYTENGESRTYNLFHDGTLNTIGNVGEGYAITSLQAYDNGNYFYTVKESSYSVNTTYTYTYYNTKGEIIGTYNAQLSYITETDDCLIMADTSATNPTYYKFAKVK